MSTPQSIEPLDVIAGIRRRWKMIVVLTIVSGMLGYALTAIMVSNRRPSSAAERPAPTWTATTILLRQAELDTSLDTFAVLSTVGEVPRRAAATLNEDIDEFLARVTVTVGEPEASGNRQSAPSQSNGAGRPSDDDLLFITATGPTEFAANRAADVLASELIDYDLERQEGELEASLGALRVEIEALRLRLLELEPEETDQRGGSNDNQSVEGTEYSIELARYATLLGDLRELEGTDPVAALSVLERPRATEVIRESAANDPIVPANRYLRVAIAMLIGLLGGIALSLLLERFDDRLHTANDAEKHLGHPVLGTVGRMSRRQRSGQAPGSGIETFRVMATALTHRHAHHISADRAMTVLVTGTGSGDGVTTVSHHLAAALAELLPDVLFMSCDLRTMAASGRRFVNLELEQMPGLADALRRTNGERVLDDDDKHYMTSGVWFVPAGKAAASPIALLGSPRMRRVLDEESAASDVVLLDSPSLLATSDAAPLVDEVDVVIVVVGAGRATRSDAERLRALLGQLGASDVAVVFNHAPHSWRSRLAGRLPSRGRSRQSSPATPRADEGSPPLVRHDEHV